MAKSKKFLTWPFEPMLFEQFVDKILTKCFNLMLINNRMNHSDNEQPVLESPNFPKR